MRLRLSFPSFVMKVMMKMMSRMSHPTLVHFRGWLACLPPCNEPPHPIEAMLWPACSAASKADAHSAGDQYYCQRDAGDTKTMPIALVDWCTHVIESHMRK